MWCAMNSCTVSQQLAVKYNVNPIGYSSKPRYLLLQSLLNDRISGKEGELNVHKSKQLKHWKFILN